MASDEFGDKTEDPTEHRRNEARRKGNVARSQDLSSAGLLIAVALGLSLFGEELVRNLASLMMNSLRNAGKTNYSIPDVYRDFRKLSEICLSTLMPLMLFLTIGVILVNVVQVGFLISPEALQPKLARLNPISGLKRMFSLSSVVRLIVSLGKTAVVVAIAAWFIASNMGGFQQLAGKSPAEILTSIQSSVVELAFWLALALLLLAVLDFGFQKWKHEQELKMTKQEVREEMKQMDGDPAMRQRRKEAHQKLAQARELQQVPQADVVIKNPTHIAVAIKYDPETTPAPVVIAKGMGVIAERIHNIAVEHGIPIIERKPLARALYRDVRVGQQIPLEMYEVFVEIMAYVYQITGRTPPTLDS
ncbi:MAG: EscU/YscU/HrcU family type III secretion system export apparatus switch protein [Planctomycetaceae bacterium]